MNEYKKCLNEKESILNFDHVPVGGGIIFALYKSLLFLNKQLSNFPRVIEKVRATIQLKIKAR